jgi:hypothetical protein
MSDAELVVIRTYATHAEAELATSALDAAEIESMLHTDDCGSVMPGMDLSRGVQVLVREGDAERAREVLEAAAVDAPGEGAG